MEILLAILVVFLVVVLFMLAIGGILFTFNKLILAIFGISDGMPEYKISKASAEIFFAYLSMHEGFQPKKENHYIIQYRKIVPSLTVKEARLNVRTFLKKGVDLPRAVHVIKKYERKKHKNKTIFLILGFIIRYASTDRLLSKKEEEIIIRIVDAYGLTDKEYQAVKAHYLEKSGAVDEAVYKRMQEASKQKRRLNKSYSYNSAYQILNVKPAAEIAEIKSAYRTLVKQWHPDKFSGEEQDVIDGAELKFQEITEAYEYIKGKRGIK